MDHHCPWLATCVGLRNYKPFILFLIYTTLFCFLCFAVSATWVWREILTEGEYTESLMPVNYVMLTVISGIIGLVLAGFTGWHILLASRGQTTIECLEKTRYLSPLRKSMQHHHIPRDEGEGNDSAGFGQQSRDINASRGPRPLDDMRHGEQRHQTYDELERARARARYDEYLDEQDSKSLPSAFDLGWKLNLLHLFGPKPLLWAFPICNTIGNGWTWEASPKWLEARDKIGREREAQRLREHAAGWGGEPSPHYPPARDEGAGRHYITSRINSQRPVSKADRILGRDSNFEDSNAHRSAAVSLQKLQPRGSSLEDGHDDISTDEDEFEQRALDPKAAVGWPRKVGVVTNSLLGNTNARKKDDLRGWDGYDEGVD